MLKLEIRKEFKVKRKSLTREEKIKRSRGIAQIVTQNFNIVGKTISVFLPIERLNEVETSYLIAFLQNANATITTPVSDFESLELKHIIYNDKTTLQLNEWGIPEPVDGVEVKPDVFDIVFVPLLAINKEGYRVGYGKGFYDRFLSQCRKDTVFIGLNYFENIVEIDDVNKDDVPIHFLVTPNKVLKF